MTDTLHGRVALVTGGSRGIGAAIARRLAAAGAAVAVHGRDRAAVDSVVATIHDDGNRALGVLAEHTNRGPVAALRAAVEADLGPVDVLIANAGGNPVRPGPLEDLTDDDWRQTIDANLTATFVTLREFVPCMKQRGRGSVVTMSSAAGRRPTAMSPIAYAAAKAGIDVLTRELALQAGPHGVRVNCLAPETILTERTLHAIPADLRDRLTAEHPLRRLGTPDDVAEAVEFLASDPAVFRPRSSALLQQAPRQTRRPPVGAQAATPAADPARYAVTGRRRLLHLAASAPFTALALQALDALARCNRAARGCSVGLSTTSPIPAPQRCPDRGTGVHRATSSGPPHPHATLTPTREKNPDRIGMIMTVKKRSYPRSDPELIRKLVLRIRIRTASCIVARD